MNVFFGKSGIAPLGLLGLCLIVCGCQGNAHPAQAKADRLVGSWRYSATSEGSNASLTLNADHTMSFTATNGPKQKPYVESGIGRWDGNDKELSMTPLSIDLKMPDEADRRKMLPYVNQQLNKRSTGAIVWKNDDEFVITMNKVDQDFKRVK